MSASATITCKPNGPYLVKDLDDLRNSRGEPMEVKPGMALCRCGGSANKPFCDGTHQRNGFSGAKREDRTVDARESYAGKRIVVHDNRSICAHAGHCTDGLPSVFRQKQEPWIDPDGAAVDAVIDAVRACPSGALSFTLTEPEPPDSARTPSITVTKDGPYAIVGGANLVGESFAEGASTEHYTLCRCGASKNKPFCDGSHWTIDFKDDNTHR